MLEQCLMGLHHRQSKLHYHTSQAFSSPSDHFWMPDVAVALTGVTADPSTGLHVILMINSQDNGLCCWDNFMTTHFLPAEETTHSLLRCAALTTSFSCESCTAHSSRRIQMSDLSCMEWKAIWRRMLWSRSENSVNSGRSKTSTSPTSSNLLAMPSRRDYQMQLYCEGNNAWSRTWAVAHCYLIGNAERAEYQNCRYPRFSKNWFKLRLLGLVEFDAIIILDSDMIVRWWSSPGPQRPLMMHWWSGAFTRAISPSVWLGSICRWG